MTSNEPYLGELQSRLSHTFKDPSLLVSALTHRSYYFENRELCLSHNERLEFLGDAVIDLAISTALMERYPDHDEGMLSRWRASLVNETHLAKKAKELNLQSGLRVGHGEEQAGAQNRPRLLASAFEAVMGAFYLDAGFDAVHAFLTGYFAASLTDVGEKNELDLDFKTRLQERIQKKFKQTPHYRVIRTEGPDHDKIFFVDVYIGDDLLAQGWGSSRKLAEQDAARVALETSENIQGDMT